MKLLLENWHKYLNETGFGEGTPAPGKWSEKKTYIVEDPEVEEYSDEKEYEELGSTEERYGGSDRDKMIYAIHFFKELEQRYPDALPEDAETIVDDLVGDPGVHRAGMINLVTKVLTPGATLTGKAPKPDSQEERGELEEASSPPPAHPRGWAPLPHTPSEVGTFMQAQDAKNARMKSAAERRAAGIPATPASTTNLKRFDRNAPEEKDPDEVGLDTLEMTEKDYEEWRSRGFFGGKF